MRAATIRSLGSILLVLGLGSCSSEDSKKTGEDSEIGGTDNAGATGGQVNNLGGGGSATGGVSTGGATTGSGGRASGGSGAGGRAAGGAGTGGSGTGGAGVGGSGVGGAGLGGDGTGGAMAGAGGLGVAGDTGGVSQGGNETGGNPVGGADLGGASGSTSLGGQAMGGNEQGGSAGVGVGGTELGGSTTGGTDQGGSAGVGGGVAGETGTGGVLAGCTPGALTASSTCNTPDFMTGAPGAAVDCVGELEGPWGSIYATIDSQQYFIQVNEWNSESPQVMSHGGDYVFRMTTQTADTGTQGVDAPTGYPAMFIGSNGGHTTTTSGLPKSLSEITSVPTTWIWNDNGSLTDDASNIFNAAYDVWFNTNASEATEYAPTGGYLMVWLYDPPYAMPIGEEPAFTAVTIEGVDGTWDIWIGMNEGAGVPCISYVRTEMTRSLSFDLKHFIDDAVTRPGGLDASWALTNIFTGFEIWNGAQGVETTAFCAFVN